MHMHTHILYIKLCHITHTHTHTMSKPAAYMPVFFLNASQGNNRCALNIFLPPSILSRKEQYFPNIIVLNRTADNLALNSKHSLMEVGDHTEYSAGFVCEREQWSVLIWHLNDAQVHLRHGEHSMLGHIWDAKRSIKTPAQGQPLAITGNMKTPFALHSARKEGKKKKNKKKKNEYGREGRKKTKKNRQGLPSGNALKTYCLGLNRPQTGCKKERKRKKLAAQGTSMWHFPLFHLGPKADHQLCLKSSGLMSRWLPHAAVPTHPPPPAGATHRRFSCQNPSRGGRKTTVRRTGEKSLSNKVGQRPSLPIQITQHRSIPERTLLKASTGHIGRRIWRDTYILMPKERKNGKTHLEDILLLYGRVYSGVSMSCWGEGTFNDNGLNQNIWPDSKSRQNALHAHKTWRLSYYGVDGVCVLLNMVHTSIVQFQCMGHHCDVWFCWILCN